MRLIASSSLINGCLCGYLTTFERGASQNVISDDFKADKLKLGSLPPPTPQRGQAPQQYIPGVVYFSILKNHVAFVSAQSIKSSYLEGHLNWLLKSRTSELGATVAFSLSDEAQKVTKEKIKKSHVKSIAFGQPLMHEVELSTVGDNSHSQIIESGKKSKKAQSAFKPQGVMLDLIKNLFDNETEFEKLGLNEVFDGNLEIWIEIRYPKRKRLHPQDAMKLMDTLGVALRDIEGDQVTLMLENGLKVTGKDLKITGSIEVELMTNNLPDEDKLYKEMIAWLQSQITNGIIDP